MGKHVSADQPKRKRSRLPGESSRTKEEDVESDPEMYGGDDQAWVQVTTPAELTGPTFLYQMRDNTAHALSINAHLMHLEVSAISPPEVPEGAEIDGALVVAAEATPQTVHQVWVSNQLPGTEGWTLKSTQGTFLGCDRYGEVVATSEARGPQEEWVVHLVAGPEFGHEGGPAGSVPGPKSGVALRALHGGWLTLEGGPGERPKVRADINELTADAVWDVRVQWRSRHQVRVAANAARRATIPKGQSIDDEARISLSRQGWTAGTKAILASGARSELLRAQREGRLSEAMLDRRVKLKSDKYTK
ncbi:hypothetical protein MCUN1_001342 [Malassezia cuniculi]|uniref:Protein FRG1 n=1 Tax=Malassezia cuniculi TaxID=948313 RepID=A0AAF0JAN9_9BASI|nr:hypothetical protein MCUN1_001342 [Malassezia cuniculi]